LHWQATGPMTVPEARLSPCNGPNIPSLGSMRFYIRASLPAGLLLGLQIFTGYLDHLNVIEGG